MYGFYFGKQGVKDFFYKRYTPREPKDGVDALDSVDPAINSFDHLRKLPTIKTDKKNLIVMTTFSTLTKLFLNSATELLEELIRRLRDRVKEARIFKITPFLTLLMTPRLRTLDLTAIKPENDISGVLHMATIISLAKKKESVKIKIYY
jgi:hypothetical protein